MHGYFEEETNTGNLNVIAKACAGREAVIVKENTAIKERSDLHWYYLFYSSIIVSGFDKKIKR